MTVVPKSLKRLHWLCSTLAAPCDSPTCKGWSTLLQNWVLIGLVGLWEFVLTVSPSLVTHVVLCVQHLGDFFPAIVTHLCVLMFHMKCSSKLPAVFPFFPPNKQAHTEFLTNHTVVVRHHRRKRFYLGDALKPWRNQNKFSRSCRVCINLKETKTAVFSFWLMLPTFTSCQSTVSTTQVSPSWALLLSSMYHVCSKMYRVLENPVKFSIYSAPHFVALAFENVDVLSLNSFLPLRPWLMSAPALPVGL